MEVGRGWPCSQQMDAGEEAPASGRNSERRQKTLGAGRRREKEEEWRRSPPVLEPRGALQAFRRSSGLQEVLRSLRGLQVFKKIAMPCSVGETAVRCFHSAWRSHCSQRKQLGTCPLALLVSVHLYSVRYALAWLFPLRLGPRSAWVENLWFALQHNRLMSVMPSVSLIGFPFRFDRVFVLFFTRHSSRA